MAAVLLALFGAAVAWLIAAVSIAAAGGAAGWAYFCLGMAVVFSALAVGLWLRERAKRSARRRLENEKREAAFRRMREYPRASQGHASIRVKGGSDVKVSDNRAYGLPVLDAEDVTGLDAQGNVTIMPPEGEQEPET